MNVSIYVRSMSLICSELKKTSNRVVSEWRDCFYNSIINVINGLGFHCQVLLKCL